MQLYADYGFVESLLQPFGSYGDNGIRNPYFRDVFDDLFAFQYGCYFAREDTDTLADIGQSVIADDDMEIIRFICSRYSHPAFIVNDFFDAYFAETLRFDKIESLVPQRIKDKVNRYYYHHSIVSEVMNPFLERINSGNVLCCGASIKRDKFTGKLFVENDRGTVYIAFARKPKDNTDDDTSKLKEFAVLFGKCPNQKELNDPHFPPEKEVALTDLWYKMPTPEYYKKAHGSIRAAYKKI